MGATPPYLYKPTSQRDSDPCYSFDPKAVTRASYYSVASTTSLVKPKQEGPLIDFNQHPDSYLIVPYGRPTLPPMHPNTKQRVNSTRWALFVLRTLQLLAALGALVSVICIRGVNDIQGWILRIPPALDAVVCSYSLYHLRRPAKARPAASSASYNAFSLFMDVGFVPFYVFIAFFSEANWSMDPGESGRWTSFFHSDQGTGKLLLAAFLIGSVGGLLHLLSIPIDVYLLMMFRKIAVYPPDMNPLEDNLTSRMPSKHKSKNSELSASVSEQKFAALSGSTLSLSSPSRVSAGNDQLIPEANVRPISFYQSRANLDGASPGSDSPRQARSMYQQPTSARASQVSMHHASGSRSRSRPSRPQSRGYSNQSRRSPANLDHEPMPARPLSFVTASENNSRRGTPQPGPQASVPAATEKEQQKQSLLNDNWYVLSNDEADLSSPRRTPLPELESDRDDSSDDHEPNAAQFHLASEEHQDLLPQPLCMHPLSAPTLPTLPKHCYDDGDFYFDDMGKENGFQDNYPHPNEDSIGCALTAPSAISARSSFYSQPSPDISRMGTPKGKLYGDLAPETKNMRGIATEQSVPRGQGRVVSRSGVDIADSSVMYVTEDSFGMRGRHVSGKIAEEGLAGVHK